MEKILKQLHLIQPADMRLALRQQMTSKNGTFRQHGLMEQWYPVIQRLTFRMLLGGSDAVCIATVGCHIDKTNVDVTASLHLSSNDGR